MTSIYDLVGHMCGNGANGSNKQEETSDDFGGSIHSGKDGNGNEQKQDVKAAQTVFGASDALRLHSGCVKVQGMITSLSQLYKMITAEKFVCGNCGNAYVVKYDVPQSNLSTAKGSKKCHSCSSENFHTDCEYVNAVTVELQDIDTFSEIERLSVLLFDKGTTNIHVGERVVVTGQIQVIQNKGKGKFLPYLYANSIHYESKEEIILTAKDIEAIERFSRTNSSKIIDRLVTMFAPSVIGYNHVKEGLLLSAVNTSTNDFQKRNRIHALSVGDPGLAKSILIREATKLVLNSRYESGQHSSGKGLILL